MNNKITLALVLLFPVCLWNCSRETVPEEYYTVEVIEGVRHVHNNKPQWGDEPKVALEFVRQIGGLDVTDENFMFFDPYDIALDNNVNHYVLDAGNFRIQKFDEDWNYLATFGRKGRGPSEFQYPNSIDLDYQGNIFIYDLVLAPIMIILDKNGKEIRRFSYEDKKGQRFRIMSSGEIVRVNCWDIPEKSLIYIFDTNGKKLREFVKAKEYNNDELNSSCNFIQFTIDNHDNIFVCFEHQNKIEKYSQDGKLRMSIDRPLNFKVTTKKVVKKITVNPPDSPPFKREVLNINRVSEGIGVDHKGRIWTITCRRQREDDDKEKYPDPHVLAAVLYRFDVFDPEGIYLGSLPVEKYFDSMHIYDDRLFFVDTYNEMCVYEYKIVEK